MLFVRLSPLLQCDFARLCASYLFFFVRRSLLTFSCVPLRIHSPAATAFSVFIMFGAFRCRFRALIFVAYYISHLIRQIVVTASFNNRNSMEIMLATLAHFVRFSFFFSFGFHANCSRHSWQVFQLCVSLSI